MGKTKKATEPTAAAAALAADQPVAKLKAPKKNARAPDASATKSKKAASKKARVEAVITAALDKVAVTKRVAKKKKKQKEAPIPVAPAPAAAAEEELEPEPKAKRKPSDWIHDSVIKKCGKRAGICHFSTSIYPPFRQHLLAYVDRVISNGIVVLNSDRKVTLQPAHVQYGLKAIDGQRVYGYKENIFRVQKSRH